MEERNLNSNEQKEVLTPKELKKTRYTKEEHFHCLENLTETPLELYLIHSGIEECRPLHLWHGVRSEYIIHFVLDGHGIYSVDQRTYNLSKGKMFLIRPGVEIAYIADETDPWTYCWIGIRGSSVERILSSCGFGAQINVLDVKDVTPILENIQNILAHYAQTEENLLLRQSYLLSILGHLIGEHKKPKQQEKGHAEPLSRTNTYVTNAISYIKLHFANNITVSDIAFAVGISRAYLNRAFQKELNMSVQHFLIDYRLHCAASLLMNTEQSIGEVARAVGYENPLAFSKAFKKKFALSPRSYREANHGLSIYSERLPDHAGEEPLDKKHRNHSHLS